MPDTGAALNMRDKLPVQLDYKVPEKRGQVTAGMIVWRTLAGVVGVLGLLMAAAFSIVTFRIAADWEAERTTFWVFAFAVVTAFALSVWYFAYCQLRYAILGRRKSTTSLDDAQSSCDQTHSK